MNINKAIIDTFSFDQKKEFLTVLKRKCINNGFIYIHYIVSFKNNKSLN